MTSSPRATRSLTAKKLDGLLPLYLSKEPTTDEVVKKLAPLEKKFDVVARRRPGGKIVARWPWHYTKSKPRRNQRTVMFNCCRWRVVWEAQA